MKGWSVGPEHLLAAHRNCEPGSDHWRRRRSGWTSYDEHPPPLYLHTVVSFFWWHFFWNKVMMLRKHPGVISRQSMRWHSHVFWKVLEFLSDLAMWTYWNPISRNSPGGLPNVCFLPWNTMKYPEVKILNMITAVITFSICFFSACFDSIIETVIDIFESDMLHVLMLPTLWNSQFEQEIRIIFSQESDIKVWLNFSYCQGRISGMEMVHLFIYISPLVTKHYKTIIPPKTNIDPKWWFPNLLFQGAPNFRCQPWSFPAVSCMFDSPGIGSLFLGTNFEFFISVLLLVRRVWLVVFGYGGLRMDNISISHDFSFFWESMVSKWLVVCFQHDVFLLFLSLYIYIYYFGWTNTKFLRDGPYQL